LTFVNCGRARPRTLAKPIDRKGERMKFQHNVGGFDRIARIAVGLALMAAIPLLDSPVRWIGLVGLVPLLTGLGRFCPLYTLIGVNTCPARKA
jgi:hypothetical protein